MNDRKKNRDKAEGSSPGKGSPGRKRNLQISASGQPNSAQATSAAEDSPNLKPTLDRPNFFTKFEEALVEWYVSMLGSEWILI